MIPPELIRGLPDGRALVIAQNLCPVVVKVRSAWKRLAELERFAEACQAQAIAAAARAPEPEPEAGAEP